MFSKGPTPGHESNTQVSYSYVHRPHANIQYLDNLEKLILKYTLKDG